MAQEFFINSQELQNKVESLLPSQGGAGAGFDLSASTQIIPIIDLTESAEGSNIRQDLQTSLSHGSITSFDVAGATTTIISNTGYFRVFGAMSAMSTGTTTAGANFSISDGSTDKIILDGRVSRELSAVGAVTPLNFDFVVFISAGDSLKAISSGSLFTIRGCTRQIADISGALVNPI